MGDDRRPATGLRGRIRPLRAPLAPRAIGKLILPAGAGPLSPEIVGEAASIAETIRTRVRARLVKASTTGRVDRLRDAIDAAAADCVSLFEQAMAAALVTNPRHLAEMDGVACRRGCAFCCHVDVVVTPLEAVRVARRADARNLAAAGDRAPRPSPCPMLDDGACSVYDIRPFACRSIFSRDARACEAGYGGAAGAIVPSLTWPRHLSSGYLTGQVAALDDLGLASHLVELRSALAVLGADAEALLRWLNGADVFPRLGQR